jgi:hypothetical protein
MMTGQQMRLVMVARETPRPTPRGRPAVLAFLARLLPRTGRVQARLRAAQASLDTAMRRSSS